MCHTACIHTHCIPIFVTFAKAKFPSVIFSGAWSLSGVTNLDDSGDIRPVFPSLSTAKFHTVHCGLYNTWEVLLIKLLRVE